MEVVLVGIISSVVSSVIAGIIMLQVRRGQHAAEALVHQKIDNVKDQIRTTERVLEKRVDSVDHKVDSLAKGQQEIVSDMGEMKVAIGGIAIKTDALWLADRKASDERHPPQQNFGKVIRKD